jgi:hypothetical protein
MLMTAGMGMLAILLLPVFMQIKRFTGSIGNLKVPGNSLQKLLQQYPVSKNLRSRQYDTIRFMTENC